MKELSQITAGFVDHGGLYLPLARKLAKTYKRVIYWDPKEEDYECVNEAVVGSTVPDDPRLERIDDLWLEKAECDLFIFPDSRGAGMQLELAGQGYPVWGGRRSMFLEQSRETFLRVLKDLGLEIPPFKRIVGITKLAEYLKDKENQIIKISKYRGTMETRKWRSWDDDEAWLDWMRVKLGGVKEYQPFLVFESIDTPFELGGDTYNILGQWPSHMLDGYEYKDKGYFGAFKAFEDMPDHTRAVMEAFAPILKTTGHRNFWSMEIRWVPGKNGEGEHAYFIDPTPRGPMPGSGSQMQLYKNLPLIVAAGAEGELVQPEADGKFTAECIVSTKFEDPVWPSIRVPAELEDHLKLSGSCKVDGREWFPTGESRGEEIGWLVAVGDTPSDTIGTMLEYKSRLPDGFEAHTESLVDLLKEIHKAEEQGIEFTPMKLPEPEEVIQDES